MAPGLTRIAVTVLAAVLPMAGLTGAAAAPAHAASARPLDEAALLTSDELVATGLAPLITADATLSPFPADVRRWAKEVHLDRIVFATSSGDRDERDAMVFIDATGPRGARVDCAFDEGVVQRRLGPTTCLGTQTPSGDRQPQYVSFGSMPVPGVNVMAVVGNPRRSESPLWTVPSTRERLALARRLVSAQVARLRAGGYLP